MRKPKIFIQLAVVGVMVITWLFFFYGDLILHPNKYSTGDLHDGIKACAVFAGHIKNDSTYSVYQNMNYPYGQVHLFTDGQTVIANLCKLLSNIYPGISDHSIAIYNLLMIFSSLGCALFLLLIIRRLNMPAVFNIAGAFCITILSPQLLRMTCHLSLSYTVFFPLCWWLRLKYNEADRKILFSMLIAANSVIWFFIHPYYVMICGLFYLFLFIVELFQNRFRHLSHISLHLFLQVLLPVLLSRIYIFFIDTHTGRSEYPWGFFVAYASWYTVFLPSFKPFGEALKSLFYPNETAVWEGLAYVGIAATLVALYLIFKMIRYLIKRRPNRILKPVAPSWLMTALIASFFVLLLSMCIPFKFGLQQVVEYIPVLKQFRALGRFTWVFYYVFTVLSLYIMFLAYRKTRIKGYQAPAYLIPLLYFGLYIVEAYYPNDYLKNFFKGNKNYFTWSEVPEDYKHTINKINEIKDGYQCMIALPFYHEGTENFGVKFTEKALLFSMVFSYWTNMPLLNSYAARSPIIEGKNIMQFFSPPWFEKAIKEHLPNRKPFLICHNREPLNAQEQWYLNHSKPLYSNEQFDFYELTCNSVFETGSDSLKRAFTDIKDSLYEDQGFLCTVPDAILYTEDFDNRKSKFIYRGAGAFSGKKKDFNTILQRDSLKLQPGTEYVISYWSYNKDELRNQFMSIIEHCDPGYVNCTWDIWDPKPSMVIKGDWSLVEKRFVMPENKSFAFGFKGDDYSSQEIFIDDLMLRKANCDVYKITPSYFAKNNLPF